MTKVEANQMVTWGLLVLLVFAVMLTGNNDNSSRTIQKEISGTADPENLIVENQSNPSTALNQTDAVSWDDFYNSSYVGNEYYYEETHDNDSVLNYYNETSNENHHFNLTNNTYYQEGNEFNENSYSNTTYLETYNTDNNISYYNTTNDNHSVYQVSINNSNPPPSSFNEWEYYALEETNFTAIPTVGIWYWNTTLPKNSSQIVVYSPVLVGLSFEKPRLDIASPYDYGFPVSTEIFPWDVSTREITIYAQIVTSYDYIGVMVFF